MPSAVQHPPPATLAGMGKAARNARREAQRAARSRTAQGLPPLTEGAPPPGARRGPPAPPPGGRTALASPAVRPLRADGDLERTIRLAVRWRDRVELEAERRIRRAVRQLRAEGRSWADIGTLLGTSGQAAGQKYGRFVDAPKPRD